MKAKEALGSLEPARSQGTRSEGRRCFRSLSKGVEGGGGGADCKHRASCGWNCADLDLMSKETSYGSELNCTSYF